MWRGALPVSIGDFKRWIHILQVLSLWWNCHIRRRISLRNLVVEVVALLWRGRLFARVVNWAEKLVRRLNDLHRAISIRFIHLLSYPWVYEVHSLDIGGDSHLILTVDPCISFGDFSQTLSLIRIECQHFPQECFKVWGYLAVVIQLGGKLAVLEEHFLYLGPCIT